MELATVRSPGRDRDVLVHRFLRPARPARLLLTVHRMRRDPLVRLVAVMALAAPWGGCNFDPEICGYDLEPGPDFWCSGDVLVETMNCPSEDAVMRQDCAS